MLLAQFHTLFSLASYSEYDLDIALESIFYEQPRIEFVSNKIR